MATMEAVEQLRRDWAPSREESELVLATGFDPAEILDELYDWAHRIVSCSSSLS